MSIQAAIGPTASSSERFKQQVGRSPVAGERLCANVLGVQVEALDMERALFRIAETLGNGPKGYVCAIGVYGVMEAQRDPMLAAAFAGAAIAVPDGMPMVWVGRLQGRRNMQRVAGPDLMLEVFRRIEFSSCRHFLYGGNEGVAGQLAAALQKRFPGTQIVGTYTPPFRELSQAEEEDLIARVDEYEPDIIWVGISTPKQDKFMHRYLPRLKTRLMFGVGAAFDFHSGKTRQAPGWMQENGLEWLFRLSTEPQRLWRRYLVTIPRAAGLVFLELLGLLPRAPKPSVLT